ncbi:MAG: M23 family metallopeptidase [Planctomycetales bacterium]|nr:M23 family metallopeptidase [Planctomycetales bacterium]
MAVLIVVCGGAARGSDGPFGNRLISPEQVGLPSGNKRNSEPFVTRIYMTDSSGRILGQQPPSHPFTISADYRLKPNEQARVHQGVDISSYPKVGEPPVPLDFNAGVHGVVRKAGDGPWGTIAVQIQDGTLIQYLHTTASHVKVGDVVAPGTPLGISGRKGATSIHLHIQAKRHGRAISPDLAFISGQKPLKTEVSAAPADAKFDPASSMQPEIADGVVKFNQRPKSKWVVEVIGMGGRVDMKLGEFPTYGDALYCGLTWMNEHPDDLRLTREREVRLKE